MCLCRCILWCIWFLCWAFFNLVSILAFKCLWNQVLLLLLSLIEWWEKITSEVKFCCTLPFKCITFSVRTYCRLVQTMDYSVIVFDTAPTGHTLRLLQFPSTLEKGLAKMMSLKNKFGGLLNQVRLRIFHFLVSPRFKELFAVILAKPSYHVQWFTGDWTLISLACDQSWGNYFFLFMISKTKSWGK